MSADERYEVAATDLRGYKVRGFLDKKRPSKKLLSVKYQRRWCVLHDSTLYYFDDPRDRRQKGAFSLIGYKFWHGGGTENSFSLVARGKRTYDFICPTIEDFERWKAGILSVTENVPSGHEVFVNKTSVSGSGRVHGSPSTHRKIVRVPSRDSSDESTDSADLTPSRPPPITRPPKRPPMPPVPRREKTPITKKQSEPSDMYSTVSKHQLSRTNTAIPVPSNKPSGWDDDLDDYDVVDHSHRKKSAANEPSYLTSADLQGSKRSFDSANKNFDSNIASLLGLKLKDKAKTQNNNADEDLYESINNTKNNRKSRKKRHQEDSALNSVPEDPYMEFVGEGGKFEDEMEDQEDLQSREVQKYSDPDDPYMEFVGEGALGEHEEEEDLETLQSEEEDKVSETENMNETVPKKPLSHLHSLQLELNSKIVKRLQGMETEVTSPKGPEQTGDDEPLYENFLNIDSLETRSLPRDMKIPSTPPLQSHKRKQSSFESNTDSSSDGEFPPPPSGLCPVPK
ncbi:uncharacterized protein LOC111130354 isoform X3 [Crassostrea virginica]